jgi:hypothetical protein
VHGEGRRGGTVREIKFRQPIFDKDGFLKWHYWGFVEKGAFFGPMPPFDRDNWQFTGKKDIEGTDIYTGDRIEGDLFDKRLPTAGTILYDESLCCFVNKNEAGNTPLFYIDKIKVIGNIYEATTPSQGDNPTEKEV